MALPMLIGGTECGPSNPLQNLSKKFDHDPGLQQDHFTSARAGPSRQTFRTQVLGQVPDQDAAQFFSSSPAPAPQFTAPTPFDLAALHHSLPVTRDAQAQQNPALAWASDFTQQQPRQSPVPQAVSMKVDVQHERGRTVDVQMPAVAAMTQGGMNWNPSFSSGYRMSPIPAFSPHIPMQRQNPMIQPDQAVWDKEFDSITRPLDDSFSKLDLGEQISAPPDTQQLVKPRLQTPRDADDLARTAGRLVESVRDERNPKFQNSQFMGLMRQLRDREIVVEGDKMVESSFGTPGVQWANNFQIDVKGKGRAVDMPTQGMNTSSLAEQLDARRAFRSFTRDFSPTRTEVQSLAVDQSSEITGANQEEDPNDVYFRQENAEYTEYWNAHHSKPAEHATPVMDQAVKWDQMQREWELFEANATGIKPIDNYQFQENNPYLLGDRSRTRQHLMHLNRPQSFYESVLELEAAVQRDPTSASAWYELGVKQQENEREQKAIEALRRAVELDSSYLPTWVALAVSYTNDNNRTDAYDAIKQWVERNTKYQDAVRRYQAEFPDDPAANLKQRFAHLIQCLITMARSDTSQDIDADIQIALAVLLNTNEDYEKAQDCFRTALALRPDDWLLYNRVGATMANSGHAEEALQYYYKALELNPTYIRARFNLGISCINLRRYDEAAQHILDALVLQDGDSVHDPSGLNNKRGVTSSSLWDNLKTTCLHMQRVDLATLCDQQDLDGFRSAFQTNMSV